MANLEKFALKVSEISLGAERSRSRIKFTVSCNYCYLRVEFTFYRAVLCLEFFQLYPPPEI